MVKNRRARRALRDLEWSVRADARPVLSESGNESQATHIAARGHGVHPADLAFACRLAGDGTGALHGLPDDGRAHVSAPVKLAKRAVGWRHDDVRQWTNGRPTTSR